MAAPALPTATAQYDQQSVNALLGVLRLYFTGQVDQAIAMRTTLVVGATSSSVGKALVVTGDGTFNWSVVPVAGANPGAKLYLFYNEGGF